jgi:hypothetical protein
MLRLRISIASLLLFSTTVCAAQLSTSYSQLPSANSAETPKYKLSGVVVNSATGEPLRNALVVCGSGVTRAMMTNSDGRFEFEGLPPSFVALGARRPGFFSEQELSEGRKPPLQLRVGPDSPSVTIRLTPEAVVFGRIVDTDGLPIPRFPLRVFSRQVSEGKQSWQLTNGAATDQDGRFRIFGLKPGKYFLSAGPSQFPAVVSSGVNPIELGYPEVTYPAGGNDDSPALVPINAGQQLEVNFTMRPERFYSVSGSVGGVGPEQRVGVVLVSKLVARQGEFTAMVDSETRTFQIPRVAPGDYTLMVSGADNSGKRLTGSVPLQVHGNVMGVHFEAQSTLSIPVRVRVERTREATASERAIRARSYFPVRLISIENESMQLVSTPEELTRPDSPNSVQNVPPGRYRVAVELQGSDLYVASARFGTTDLLSEDLVANGESGQGQIEIVLRDDPPILHVMAAVKEPNQNPRVVVVPSDGEPYLYDDHTFRTPPPEAIPVQLRPGSFTIFLFDNVEDLEYASREALEPYLSKGVRVTLARGEEKTISPELIRRGDE